MGTCPDAADSVEVTVRHENDPTTVTEHKMVPERFAQFCQTYGPHEKEDHTLCQPENTMMSSPISSERDDGFSFWNHVFSIYLPVVLLWLRRSMFGTANLLRSLVLGNFLLLLLNQFNPPDAIKDCAWWNTLCAALGANVKTDPQAWPPPALSILAILTVVALIIHPDGFTWMIWRKIRECIIELLRSTVWCWNVVVHDYGILPSVIASATFASLMFLAVIVYKTLSPRKERNDNPKNERKKKKRRNHHHSRTGGARIKGIQPTQTQPRILKQQPDATPKSDGTISLPPPTNQSIEPTTPQGIPKDCVPLLEEKVSNISSEHSPDSIKDLQLLPRQRVPSVSTIDTTTLTDDQSCESSSVRSSGHVNIASVSSFDPPAENSTSEPQPIAKAMGHRFPHRGLTMEEPIGTQFNRSKGKKPHKDWRSGFPTEKAPPDHWDFQRPSRRYVNGRRASGNHVHPHRNNRTGRNAQSFNSYHPTDASTFSVSDPTMGAYGMVPNTSSQQRTMLPPRSPDFSRRQFANQHSPSTALLTGREGHNGSHSTLQPKPELMHVSHPDDFGVTYDNAHWNSGNFVPRPMIRPPPGLTLDSLDHVPLDTRPTPALLANDSLFPILSDTTSTNPITDAASLEATRFYPATVMPSYNLYQYSPSPETTTAAAFGNIQPLVRDNPFEDDDDEMESRIEAELQELGGKMAGSILDF